MVVEELRQRRPLVGLQIGIDAWHPSSIAQILPVGPGGCGSGDRQAFTALPYSLDTYPLMVERCRRKLRALGVHVVGLDDRDRLVRYVPQVPDLDDVRAVNDAFYSAHEARDLEAMRSVWERADRAVCVHPGWPILRGWPEVEQSWRQIFTGPGRNQFLLTNESFEVGADLACVTLEENLVDRDSVVAVAATNVFARTDVGWKMIAHHGSAIMVRLG